MRPVRALSGRSWIDAAFLAALAAAAIVFAAAQSGGGGGGNATLSSDLSALVDFKAGLIDPGNRLAGWNPSNAGAPCGWKGVTCFGGRVWEIHLPRMKLHGSIADLGRLTSLDTLSLHTNAFNGSIPDALSTASNLRVIYLHNNAFVNQVPAAFANLQRLQVLNLANNRLTGPIPRELGRLTALKTVDLSINFLSGGIPSELSNCSRLLSVNFAKNRLTGSIPATLGDLGLVTRLTLSSNQLTGTIPSSLGNCSRLASLDLERNSLSGNIPDTLYRLQMLEMLILGSNKLDGELSPGLGNLSALTKLSLEGNKFRGSIPTSAGDLKQLQVLNLSGNSLSGGIPPELAGCAGLQVLDLQSNDLGGGIPMEIASLTQLRNLTLSFNKLSGDIPPDLFSLPRLETLRLQGNQLSGELPNEPDTWNSMTELQILNLRANNLSGDIPSSLFKVSSLKRLALSYNKFTGIVPHTVGSLQGLQALSLSHNSIGGNIPLEIGNCSKLELLDLSYNRLRGQIPSQVGYLSNLRKLLARNNALSGSIPETLIGCKNLTQLNLGSNRLSGSIPALLGGLEQVQQIRLRNNSLTGGIPSSFKALTKLQALDLSVNNLTGPVPSFLADLQELSLLNVSDNDLQGEIPPALSRRFGAGSFQGNAGLCGKPLIIRCSATTRKRLSRKALIGIVVAAGVVGVLLVLSGCYLLYVLLRRKNPNGVDAKDDVYSGSAAESGNLVMFHDPIPYDKVLEATRQFDEESVLSRTRFGVVFKACLQDGTVLSVKRLPDGSIDEKLFRSEAERLGGLKHKNLLVLRGYYYSPDVKLLIYDYMPNGNLAVLLQQANNQDGSILDWRMRHLIALNIARGLQFLHSCDPAVVHGDVRPHNVQFDADFEPHVAEFGIERLALTPSDPSTSTSSTPAGGSLGYVAPEAGATGLASRESDVYGFGILLLELLTGRKPATFSSEEDIVKWVKRQLQGRQVADMFDPGLLELFDQESSEWEEFLLAVKVALLCTAPDPTDRPSMTEVVFMLEGCRSAGMMEVPSSNPTSYYTSPLSAV